MAILATVAFGSRVTLDEVQYEGIEGITSAHVARGARRWTWSSGSSGARRSSAARSTSASRRRSSTARHPLAAVEGAFNAVMLQGDAIREITLNGPGAGGIETASAVVADMVSIIGTTGTGFLHNDSAYRELEHAPARGAALARTTSICASTTGPGVLAHMAERLAAHNVSVARLVQHEQNGGAALHVVTHEAQAGDMEAALAEIRDLPGDDERAGGAARDLRARRRGARMGVTHSGSVALAERYRDRLPIDADTPIVSLGEGGDAAPLRAAPLARSSASSSTSSSRARTRPGASRTAA